MAATLFNIPASHPTKAAALMLDLKGIHYRRIDLVAVISRPVLRVLGFPATTVPALLLDGAHLQGTRNVSRALDALRPDPPLFPADAERRLAVERAELWGDEALQPVPRRLAWAALRRDSSALRSFLEGARLGIPTGLAVKTAAPVVWAAGRLNRASNRQVREDLERLPQLIDRVDELIAEGVIGGVERNAADFQIATSVRLLMCFEDLRPALETRPAGRHALEVVPEFPGRVPPVFPADWLRHLRGHFRA